jgi:hypothetical protein
MRDFNQKTQPPTLALTCPSTTEGNTILLYHSVTLIIFLEFVGTCKCQR